MILLSMLGYLADWINTHQILGISKVTLICFQFHAMLGRGGEKNVGCYFFLSLYNFIGMLFFPNLIGMLDLRISLGCWIQPFLSTHTECQQHFLFETMIVVMACMKPKTTLENRTLDINQSQYVAA